MRKSHLEHNGELEACLLIEMMKNAAIRGQINVILKAPHDIVWFKENAQGTEASYMASFVDLSSNPKPVALIMCHSHGIHFERLRASTPSPTFSEGAPLTVPLTFRHSSLSPRRAHGQDVDLRYLD